MSVGCDISNDLFSVGNVKCFGAIGDGITDDTAAIQAAINSSPKKGTVFFPRGTYIIGAPLVVRGDIELCGAGPGVSIIKLAANAQSDMMINFAALNSGAPADENISIRNLELDGNKQNNPRKSLNPGASQLQGSWDQAGIHWKRVSRSRIVNCYIHDCAWSGIQMSAGRDNQILNTRSDDNGNVTVGPNAWGQFEAFGIAIWSEDLGANGFNANNRIVSCTTNGNEKHGIEILGVFDKDNLIMSCHAADNNGYGIMLNCGGSTHSASIIGCTCMGNAEGGIAVVGDDVVVEGNYLAHNNTCVFRGFINKPPPVGNAALSVIQGNFCTLSNNIVRDAMPKVTGNLVEGIYVSGNHNKVIGNTVVRVQQRGIIFGGISNIVMGNTVLKTALRATNGKMGIQGNTSTNAIVEGNVVRESRGAGIYFNGPGGGHRVTGNQVEDNGLNGIVLEFQMDCVVEGNVCRGNGVEGTSPDTKTGIALVAGAMRTIVNGNRCGNDPTKTPVQEIGLLMAGASDQALVNGNIFLGNAGQGMLLVGAGNVVGANMV